jgi:hypothetical protein
MGVLFMGLPMILFREHVLKHSRQPGMVPSVAEKLIAKAVDVESS